MSIIHQNIRLIGYASGLAASQAGCSEGPIALKNSVYLNKLSEKGLIFEWDSMIKPNDKNTITTLQAVTEDCTTLAKKVSKSIQEKKFFTVIGGDHSCAIGTWSGVYHEVKSQGSLGLIWIDAHLDSHTEQTSETGNIHGMPLACLLGYGNASLISIMDSQPKLEPQNICIIGARSYEPGEEELIKKLNVKVFFMNEIKERGLAAVLEEAVAIVTKQTAQFGITIDVDSIDPEEAPGTGVSEPGGLSGQELCKALALVKKHPKLLGAEIVEFDPYRDKNNKTEKLVVQLLASLTMDIPRDLEQALA